MTSKKILLASHNPGKVKEFRKILKGYKLISLKDLNIIDDVEEDGITYKANSEKKAIFYSKLTGLPTIADDGGLEISYLNNEPGIKSRRWLGYTASDQELFDKLKKVSLSLPDDNRLAKFRVAVSFMAPKERVVTRYGSINGIIAKQPFDAIATGLVYRLYFYLPKLNKFYHEDSLTNSEMLKINHRLIAIKKLLPIIDRYFE